MKDNNYTNLVEKLIDFTPFIEKEHITEFVRLTNELRGYLPDQKPERDTYVCPKYLNLDDVCSIYNLSKNNVKDRKWRKRVNFPLGNETYGGKLSFNVSAVEEWMNERYVK